MDQKFAEKISYNEISPLKQGKIKYKENGYGFNTGKGMKCIFCTVKKLKIMYLDKIFIKYKEQ